MIANEIELWQKIADVFFQVSLYGFWLGNSSKMYFFEILSVIYWLLINATDAARVVFVELAKLNGSIIV